MSEVEDDARWRLRGGAWTVRLVAVFYAVSGAVTLAAAGGAFARTAALSFACAAVLFLAAARLEHGNKLVAFGLFAFFVLGEGYARLIEGRMSGPGILFGLFVLGALANAAWGAVLLERARRAGGAPAPGPGPDDAGPP